MEDRCETLRGLGCRVYSYGACALIPSKAVPVRDPRVNATTTAIEKLMEDRCETLLLLLLYYSRT